MFAVASVSLWLAFFAFFAQAFPALSSRDVIAPRITSPTKDSVWPVGSVQTVTWDTSNFPPDNQITNPIGRVLLGFDENDSLNLDIDHPLAQGFKLRDGSVQVTVPNVPPKDNYLIVLMGDSGNTSPTFTITRITNGPASLSSSSAASSSTSSSSQAPPAPSPPSSAASTPVTAPVNPVAGAGSTSSPTTIGDIDATGTSQPTPTSPTTTNDQAPPSAVSDSANGNTTGAAISLRPTGLFGFASLCAGAVSLTLLLVV